MMDKMLRIYKVYYDDEWCESCHFFIPAYSTEDAIKYSEEAGIVVQFVQEVFIKEGFWFE